jgi:hypothetical protein
MPESLHDALEREIRRNEELLEAYESIPTGRFGSVVIKEKIAKARQAIAEQDAVECLRSLRSLEASR